MSPTADVVQPAAPLSLQPNGVKRQDAMASRPAVQSDDSLRTVDELLRARAKSHPHLAVVAYPSSGIEYVEYTFQQLDIFAYRVGAHLQLSMPSRASSEVKRTVVAMLGPSNLEYLVTMMALIKLGHTILFLSTRISPAAIESLVKTTGASHILADSRFQQAASAVKAGIPELSIADMPSRKVFEHAVGAADVTVNTQLDAELDPTVETGSIVYIIHSSGKLTNQSSS
jgi:acyl-CoA synthetase (AMP-forming)/AMP-acid ligase II